MKITLKTAKLAKEKNYNEPNINIVMKNIGQFRCFQGVEMRNEEVGYSTIEGQMKVWRNISSSYDYFLREFEIEIYSCPIQSELQKWFRDNDIHVWIKPSFHIKGNYCYFISKAILTEEEYFYQSTSEYKTYEEALEEGLFAALDLI